MERQQHNGVRKVLISPKLEGKAGREHLSGILSYLDEGHVWDVRIARAEPELTASVVREALDGGTEGFLLSVVSSSRQRGILRMLAESRASVVILDNHEPCARGGRFSYVRFDTAAIVAAGLDYFGRTIPGADVAFVPAPSREAWSTARERAFRSLAAKRAMAHHVYGGGDAGRGLAAWLAALPAPTGVLAANDMTALLVVEKCAEAGIDVPERLAVLGIDNDELICGHSRPPIATIEPNFAGAGFIAAATLQSLMEGRRTPRCVTVGESVNRIVARQSARPDGGRPALTRRAMDLISANAARLDVRSLADALGVSRTKLADAFAKAGTSVAAEIRDARFAKVFKLLSDPRQAIGPIANLCGWKSETHLMHSFRRRTGMTMRDWRSRHLSKGDG
ncbi:MAG: substrate-binding domain-containing protein [Kiritimatiellae bacterium]|nr:substrate-binding domain-containing protein [Kiritimatiellia bacterium]